MSDHAVEMMNRQIGRALAERRREARKRQEDVAGACGISRSSLANIENGRQPVSLALLYKISNVLNVEDARSFLPKRLALETKSVERLAPVAEVKSTEEVSDVENEAVQRALASGVMRRRK